MEEMTMKKIYMLIVALVAAVSCSMLEENTDSFVSPANFYKSVSQARAGVNGCYIPLKSIYNYNMALAVEDTDACVDAVRSAGYTITMEPTDICIESDPPYPARIAFCIGPVGEELEFFHVK